jgi:hypothetical protein
MKKYLLLFILLPLLSIGQTYSEINDLIDNNLASGTKITAAKHREVEHALLDYIQNNLSQSGDIKAIKADITYLNANFETNGLGKNLRLGWAICNGNNGTDNLTGRVGVGYGIGYSLGVTGGSKDAVVVAHSHGLSQIKNHTNNFGVNGFFDQANGGASTSYTTDATGVSGTDKNMQPYMVQLYIMKL